MQDETATTMKNETAEENASELSSIQAFLEIVAVAVTSMAGLFVGSLTGWVPMAPILGMVFPLILATYFLRRQKSGWRKIGFCKRLSIGPLIGWTLAAIVLSILANGLIVGPILYALDAPETDISILTESIEGNLLNYVVFMIFIVWGSAGFGEEFIARGFILDRFSKLFGAWGAVPAQAVLFGLAHSYQGISGMVMIFALAIVFGAIFVRCGKSLWPVILAHGIIDSIAITAIYLGHGDTLTGG